MASLTAQARAARNKPSKTDAAPIVVYAISENRKLAIGTRATANPLTQLELYRVSVKDKQQKLTKTGKLSDHADAREVTRWQTLEGADTDGY